MDTLRRSALTRLCVTALIPLLFAVRSSEAGSQWPTPSDDRAPVTLHLDDVDVRKALELLGRQGSVNIMVSPGVSGRVTADLRGLSLDQALDALIKLCNLVAHREDGILLVYTPEEFARLKPTSQQVSTRVYRLNYVRGIDVEQMITPFLSEYGRVAVTPVSEVGIASDTDHVGGDSLAGGDVVVVQDYESVLKAVDQIVAQLDVRPTQVLIEAVILEVQLDDDTDLGVNFAVLDGAGDVLTLLGNGLEINAAAGFDPASVLTAGGKLVGSSTTGFAADTHGIKFGFVDDDVTGFVRALEVVGEVNILASPRLMVLNKQRAELIVGERIGFKTTTITETAAIEKIEFLDVGTQLRLRPFVASDGIIRMEIHPERSSGKLVDGLPQESTREVTTNVLVRDGSTIVIAGLIDEEERLDLSGVPVLSKLRWLGAFFRQKITTYTKTELIVLLTPHICDPAVELDPSFGGDSARKLRGRTPAVELRSEGLGEAIRGQPYHARVTASNQGGQRADGVQVRPVLPDGMTPRSGVQPALAIGTLEPGESKTVETSVLPLKEGSMRVRFIATGKDNLVSQTDQAVEVREPQLKLEISGTAQPSAHRTTVYRVAVRNTDGTPIRPVQLVVQLPQAVQLVWVSNEAESKADGTSVAWSLQRIDPDERRQFSLRLRPTRAGEFSILAYAFTGDTLLGAAEKLIRVPEESKRGDQGHARGRVQRTELPIPAARVAAISEAITATRPPNREGM